MGTSIPRSDSNSSTRMMTPTADGLERFRSSLHGPLLAPQSPGYDQARTIWNAMIDRRPALIVRCTDATDVVQAVRFAREHGMTLAVRGGGHNVAGTAVCDGGLMIDLSPMAQVQVDPDARTARVGGGALLSDFDREAQKHALAIPLGINSTTGVAGLTLGGGFGWLSRRYGLTIDSLLSADVVTAAGDVVRASESENPDLFWAIRGGGGNFGVVTSFEFRLHEVGPEVLSGLVIHPLDDAGGVIRFCRDFIRTAPEEMVCWIVLRKAPPAPFIPAEWHGREIVVLAMCYSGKDLDEGARIAAPLRGYGRPVVDVVAPQPYTAWQQALDPLLGPGARNYWKSRNATELSDGLIDTCIDFARTLPDPQTDIGLLLVGGAVSRVSPTATAYASRDAEWVLNIHGRWADHSGDDAGISWTRRLFDAAAPFASGGAYVNFMTLDEDERIRACYGENYDRLVAIKARWDPTNLFHGNQNIKPMG